MELIKAFTLSLGEVEEPVVTSYMLGKILHHLYREKRYKGESLNRLQKDYCDLYDFNKSISKLMDEGVLSTYKGIPGTVYAILGRTHASPEDVACTVDPFCYLSHLSAMEFHGLTDRIPTKIHLSTPSPKLWKDFASKRMEQDLKSELDTYLENKLPKLMKNKFDKIGNKEIIFHHSSHLGAFKNVRNRQLRVSTIGRTFLDMLKNPELCGGMNHVLNVYSNYTNQYLKLIINEVNDHGKDIDKVRAGYILDEKLGIQDERVESWLKYAQRGGSRKLDPSEEYIPQWSEKWCLSINTFERSL
jgi:predicted transcriptional regulator of viral defense system